MSKPGTDSVSGNDPYDFRWGSYCEDGDLLETFVRVYDMVEYRQGIKLFNENDELELPCAVELTFINDDGEKRRVWEECEAGTYVDDIIQSLTNLASKSSRDYEPIGLSVYYTVEDFRETRTRQRNLSSRLKPYSRRVTSRFIRSSRYNDVESLIRDKYENIFNEMDELIPEYALFTVFGRDENGDQLTVDYTYGQGTPLSTIVDDFENQIDGLGDDYGHIDLIDLDVEHYYS